MSKNAKSTSAVKIVNHGAEDCQRLRNLLAQERNKRRQAEKLLRKVRQRSWRLKDALRETKSKLDDIGQVMGVRFELADQVVQQELEEDDLEDEDDQDDHADHVMVISVSRLAAPAKSSNNSDDDEDESDDESEVPFQPPQMAAYQPLDVSAPLPFEDQLVH